MANEKNAKDHLIKKFYEVTADFHPKDYRKHKVMIIEGIINKLDQLALECTECSSFFNRFETDIIDKLMPFNNANQREYHLNLKKILAHLRREHKLVMGGYYIELSTSVGIILGFLIGLAMNNLGVGVAIGFVMGMAVGVALDGDAKKKGNVIMTPPRQP